MQTKRKKMRRGAFLPWELGAEERRGRMEKTAMLKELV